MSNSKDVVAVISQIALKLIKANPGLILLGSAIAEKAGKELPVDEGTITAIRGIVSETPEVQTSVAADLGRLITLLCMSANQERENNPDLGSEDRGKAARDFFSNTDFGEILEVLEKSEGGVQAAMGAFNEALWSYPGKVGCIMSMSTSFFRIMVRVLTEALAPIKYGDPSSTADMICTLIRDIKPEEMAKLGDAVGELIRRVHTGSQLIGKGDKSKLEFYLDDLTAAYHKAKDPYLQKMLPIYLGEIRESFAKASARSLKSNEEIFFAQLASLGAVKTLGLKAKAARLSVFEAADDEKLGSVISDTVNEFGKYDAAELVNSLCRILNKLHDVKPDLFGNLLSGITDSIASDEVRKTASWLVPDAVNAVKPLIQDLKPVLLRGLAELIRNDGYSDAEHDEAVNELRAALSVSGGAR
jgi:hypothetical protein